LQWHRTREKSRCVRHIMPAAVVPASLHSLHPIRLLNAAESGDSFHQDLLRGFTHKLNNLLGFNQGFR
jgi:hypothetical protein